ncbi:MAG: hypothetical protein LT080_15675 [Thiobacillus sp.]|nr:hypothetical protein [Thiobacillus sp.]
MNVTTPLNWSHSAYAAVRIFLMALLGLPIVAWAHSNEHLATMKGAHGGMLRMAEMYHFELVVKDGEAHVWVTDHGDTPQSTKGAVGTLRFINGNDAFSLYMAPTGSNQLVIKDARIKPHKGTRLVLTVSMRGEAPLQTRFALD